ncbi:MAG: creatininase family protein, partial [Gammaproteobacteria bacterium]|nr:creatininase family protein [Gammaproteobacteria bacterium]
VKFHNWWNAPATWKKVMEIDPLASHASWMENFLWTRLAGEEVPAKQKPMIDIARIRSSAPVAARSHIGDGNLGGYYQHSDEDMLVIWSTGVEETRDIIANHWT